ncbi:MAG: hypothetical protein ACXVBW_09105, partial [Bdellovibrionota bacterium]
MGTENKANAVAAPANVAQLEAETQDEIEKIMNEIESLQQEMDSVDSKTAGAGATATVAPPAKAKPALAAVPTPPAPPAADLVNEEELQSFDSPEGNVEGAMAEETMQNLNKSKSILDQAFDPEYGPVEETPVEHHDEEMPAEMAEPVVDAIPEPESEGSVEESVTDEEIEASVEHMVDDIERNLEEEMDQSQGAMSMKITGKMQLRLQYDYEGQQAIVTFGSETICV